MSWNYRVIKHRDHKKRDYYSIHEVFYTKGGKPNEWTEDAVGIGGDTLDELREDLEAYALALGKPVLTEVRVGLDVRLTEAGNKCKSAPMPL